MFGFPEVDLGTRGPPPKRSDKRLGHVSKAQKAVEKAPGASGVKRPPAKADWHPLAKRWFQSLARSGQSEYYEPADWETAWVLAESMSREFKPQVVGTTSDGEPIWAEVPPRGTALSAWRQMMSALLVTEGDRRRVGLELQREAAKEAEADVSELDEYRRRLQSS
jgi:hypothetical protein